MFTMMQDLLGEGLAKVRDAVAAQIESIYGTGIEATEAKIRGVKEKLASQQEQLGVCLGQVDTIEAVTNCQTATYDVMQVLLRDLESKTKKMGDVLEQVSQSVMECDSELETLDDQRRSLRADLRGLTENIFEGKQDLKRICESLIAADKEMSILELKWGKRERIDAQLSEEVRVCTAKSKDLRLEESGLRTKAAQATSLWHMIQEEEEKVTEEIEKSQQQKEVLENALREQAQQLAEEVQVHREMEEKIQTMQIEYEKLSSLNSVLQQSLTTKQCTKQDLVDQMASLCHNTDEQKSILENADAELLPLKERKEWLEQVLGENDVFITEVQGEMAAVERDIAKESDRRSELSSAAAIRDSVLSSIAEIEDEIEQTKQQLKTLEYKLACVSQDFGQEACVPSFATPTITNRQTEISPTTTGMRPSKLFPNCVIATGNFTKGDSQPLSQGNRNGQPLQ